MKQPRPRCTTSSRMTPARANTTTTVTAPATATATAPVTVAVLLPPRVACLRSPGKRRLLSRSVLRLRSTIVVHPRQAISDVADGDGRAIVVIHVLVNTFACASYVGCEYTFCLRRSVFLFSCMSCARASNIASMRRPIVAAQPDGEASTAASISSRRRR